MYAEFADNELLKNREQNVYIVPEALNFLQFLRSFQDFFANIEDLKALFSWWHGKNDTSRELLKRQVRLNLP